MTWNPDVNSKMNFPSVKSPIDSAAELESDIEIVFWNLNVDLKKDTARTKRLSL